MSRCGATKLYLERKFLEDVRLELKHMKGMGKGINRKTPLREQTGPRAEGQRNFRKSQEFKQFGITSRGSVGEIRSNADAGVRGSKHGARRGSVVHTVCN